MSRKIGIGDPTNGVGWNSLFVFHNTEDRMSVSEKGHRGTTPRRNRL
jgi:hypothetical protein